MRTTIDSSGRLVIPKEICQQAQIGPENGCTPLTLNDSQFQPLARPDGGRSAMIHDGNMEQLVDWVMAFVQREFAVCLHSSQSGSGMCAAGQQEDATD